MIFLLFVPMHVSIEEPVFFHLISFLPIIVSQPDVLCLFAFQCQTISPIDKSRQSWVTCIHGLTIGLFEEMISEREIRRLILIVGQTF